MSESQLVHGLAPPAPPCEKPTLLDQNSSAIAPPTVLKDLTAPREPRVAYIDEEQDEELEEEYDEEDEEEYDDFDDVGLQRALELGMDEINDQDWDSIAGDFTKRYNRMRQLVVATHAALPRSAVASSSSDPAVRPGNLLPASNRPRATAKSTTPLDDPNNKTGMHLNKVSDQLATYSRYAARIDLAPLYPTSATTTRKGGSEKTLVKDKSDRATSEQVLDPRTRLIVFKMIGRGLIERVDGCVSTGKEANVYHAVSPEKKHLALKIYKTSILIFKDRDRYVSGEFRFKSGYSRSNPRKMVRLWAEKEMRNLRRMKTSGMRVPEAFEVRENVLVMEFMGEDEWQASPRLKDAELPADRIRELYIELVVILRAMFVRCRLVHADFSEYNILYHDHHLWVIDVSQSVEGDHPHAFDFLRSDIKNGDDFFARRGIETLGLTRTFNFVTRDTWIVGRPETDAEIAEEVEKLLVLAESEEPINEEEEELLRTEAAGNTNQLPEKRVGSTKPSESDERVFAQSYIPRALDQVYDPERDVARVLRGEGKELIYSDITGVAAIHRQDGARFADDGEEGTAGDALAEGDESESGSGSESDSEYDEKTPRGKKHEDRNEKKARRAETKEKARDKRKDKMGKGEKARKVKKTSGKK